jgi:hypothetical protein
MGIGHTIKFNGRGMEVMCWIMEWDMFCSHGVYYLYYNKLILHLEE